MSNAAARISVILPAYNEERTIASVIQGCRKVLPEPSELLVVDDGSTDATAERARACGAEVIELGSNRGKGQALRLGIQRSTGDVLVFLDCDGQDDPEEIPLLLHEITAGADLVVGSRFLGRFEPGAITTINRFGNRAITAVVNLLFGARLTDTQAGFRAVRRSLLQRLSLRADRYDIETDLLLQAMLVGGRVVEIPVRRSPRHHGASGLSPIIDGSRILLRIVRTRFASPIGVRNRDAP